MKNTVEKITDTSQVQSIAKNLRMLMKIHNVSESEIARTLNTSVMTVRRVISGETEDPRISTLKLIASYFNVSVDSLLNEDETKSIKTMEKKSPQFIPILDWNVIKEVGSINDIDFSEWKEWYPVVHNDDIYDQNTFALESRPSMQPRFKNGTLFIIDPDESVIDGDIILIKMKDNKELSLRELVIDSPRWLLQPVVTGSEVIFYDKNQHSIVGVVVLTVLHTRKR